MINRFPLLAAVVLTAVITGSASAEERPMPAGVGPADPAHIALYQMPKADLQTRWYTFENQKGLKGEGGKERFGRKGAPATVLPAGKELVLADVQGSGTVRRIWMTLFNRDATALRGIKIVCTWDGADTPAVQAPLGDFFCQAMGHMTAFENACFSSPEARSFNCIVPMPFRKSARVSLVNESGVNNGVYYEVDCTLGDRHDENAMYFHSYWRRENMTKVREDMTILPRVEGRGRFLGCNVGVRQHPSMTNFWWGEGEVKVYLDGDTEHATLVGTGTEDYTGSGYGLGLYAHRYQGCQYVSEKRESFGFYRLHIPDPVYFQNDCRVTIQVMGGPSYEQMLESMKKDPSLKFMKAGKGGEYYTREELEKNRKRAEVMERIDDYAATAYWYLDKPANGLPAIAPAADRMKELP